MTCWEFIHRSPLTAFVMAGVCGGWALAIACVAFGTLTEWARAFRARWAQCSNCVERRRILGERLAEMNANKLISQDEIERRIAAGDAFTQGDG